MLIFLGLYGSQKGKFLISILEIKPLVWMGRMAYGVYLWHFDFLVIAQSFNLESNFETRPFYTFLLASSMIIATFITAYLSYRLIFLPVQKFWKPKEV
jgi:peptidoglycan/LPS O-acetylase OafA/YrhL